MIIVQLTGGLGNQLFQYAFGKALAIRNECKFKLDLSMFEMDGKREYSLAPFSVTATIASTSEREILQGKDSSKLQKIRRILFYRDTKIIEEKVLCFNPKHLSIKKPAYIIGYWQSEKYFLEFEKEIRNEFHISVEPSSSNQVILMRINTCNSISLHIRRGDFIYDRISSELHGSCSIQYYQKAVDLISSTIANPVFFIFSDDINWAKANLHLNFETVFIDINDAKTDYEDLRLMSSCKHHILANSTFSWWGAWLNPSLDKIVIAPQKWFADEEWNNRTSDLIPTTWIRI